MKLTSIKSLYIFLSSIINEVLILFLFIFVINNILYNEDVRINSDGKGYFDYLPSIFIYQDFIRLDCNDTDCPKKYERVNKMGVYNTYKDKKVDKYTCGTALLESPFFLVTFITHKRTFTVEEAYQTHYQHAVFYAALFYLFLALILLKALLKLYKVNLWIITTMQLLVVFATGLSYYANYNAGYSHVFSFFAVTWFSFNAKNYLLKPNSKYFFYAVISLGLVVLIRPANAVLIFFIPFLAENSKAFAEGIAYIFKRPLQLMVGMAIFLCLMSLQSVAWYLQTGDFFLYSYGREGFNWLNPQIANVLFSYRKGLFVYSPALFIAALSVIWFFFSKRSYEGIMLILFFLLITYIISSWRSWSYGCSYGMRPYIDYLVLFIIPLALFLQHSKVIVRVIVLFILFGLAVLNQVQTYQYKEYILTWDSMDKSGYWKVFLQTSDNVKGVIWKIKPDIKSLKETPFPLNEHIELNSNSQRNLFVSKGLSVTEMRNLKYVKLSLKTDFSTKNDAAISMRISDTLTLNAAQYGYINLLRMAEKDLNTVHKGEYFFKIGQNVKPGNYVISISLITKSRSIVVDSTSVSFYSK